MENLEEEIEWHTIYHGYGSVTGGDWFEDVAYLGDGNWLVKMYDDPAFSFDSNEPENPEQHTSETIVDWVLRMDSYSEEDSVALPRAHALLEVAKTVGDECVASTLKNTLEDEIDDNLEQTSNNEFGITKEAINKVVATAKWDQTKFGGGGAMWASIGQSLRGHTAITFYVEQYIAKHGCLPTGHHEVRVKLGDVKRGADCAAPRYCTDDYMFEKSVEFSDGE